MNSVEIFFIIEGAREDDDFWAIDNCYPTKTDRPSPAKQSVNLFQSGIGGSWATEALLTFNSHHEIDGETIHHQLRLPYFFLIFLTCWTRIVPLSGLTIET